MTKSMQKISLFLVLLLFVTFVSCNYFDRKKHQNNPTDPLSAEQMANFWSGRAESGNFDQGDLNGKTTFTVQAGEYLFQYVTNYGTFYVAFRAVEDATLHIGIHPEDTCHASHLFGGTIKSGATALHTDGFVEIFSWPSASEVSWKDVIDVPSFTEPAEPAPSPEPSEPGIPIATGDTCCWRTVNDTFTVPPEEEELANKVTDAWFSVFASNMSSIRDECPILVEYLHSGWQPPLYNPNADVDYTFVGNLTTEGSGDVLYHLHVQLMDNVHGTLVKEAETSWHGDDMIYQHVSAMAKTFSLLDELLFVYEGLPQTASLTPEKNPINAGEQMTIQVNVKAGVDMLLQNFALKPWQWILVRAEKGKILNGTFDIEDEGFEYRRFQGGEGTITLNYQAPPEELAPTSDTITIYNTCQIHPQLPHYMLENEIGRATFEISKSQSEEPSEPPTPPGASGGYCYPNKTPCRAKVSWRQYCVDANGCVYYVFGDGKVFYCTDYDPEAACDLPGGGGYCQQVVYEYCYGSLAF